VYWCDSGLSSHFYFPARAVQTPQAPISKGVMSAADGLAWNEEDGSAILSTLTSYGRQADISWLHLS
jgi:hypothetical protein